MRFHTCKESRECTWKLFFNNHIIKMKVVDAGKRSTLLMTAEGSLVRRYADTRVVSDPFPPCVDSNGNLRCSGNRLVDSLMCGRCERRPPPHLRTTMTFLCRRPRTIDVVATYLGVTPNTAWSYVCRAVDCWPEVRTCADRRAGGACVRRAH